LTVCLEGRCSIQLSYATESVVRKKLYPFRLKDQDTLKTGRQN
jgi:hypothetical protein